MKKGMSAGVVLQEWEREVNSLLHKMKGGMTAAHSLFHLHECITLKPLEYFAILKQKEQELMQMKECVCGSGLVKSKCHKDVVENSLVAHLLAKYQRTDAQLLEEAIRHSVQSVCHKGCSDCCDYYFYISKVEYFAIRNHIETQFPERMQIYVQRAQNQLFELKECYPEEFKKIFTPSAAVGKQGFVETIAGIHFRKCIFCNEQSGECEVYQSRPFTCRFFGTTYRHNICSKIEDKLHAEGEEASVEALSRYMVDAPYFEDYEVGTTKFVWDDMCGWVRPMPIMFWFATAQSRGKEYTDAMRLPEKSYVEKYIRR